MYIFEQTLSIRLVWPLLRLAGNDPWLTDQLSQMGIGLRELGDPEMRAPHRSLVRVLEQAVVRYGDASVGLRAGRDYQVGDLDSLEQVANTAPTLRDAIQCLTRFQRLMHSALSMELEERGDVAMWRVRIHEQPQVAAANDYALSLAATFARAHTGIPEPILEVHVDHERTPYAEEYNRTFGGSARFSMPHNALVFRRGYLDAPMRHANPALHAACELAARDQLLRVAQRSGVSGKVRELVTSQLRSGDTRMSTVAESLAMSVATLRRRLDEEGTSHTDILDEVRHELAKTYLRDPRLAISEIAFMLGFAHVAAFYKAFRRWTGGSTPANFRGRTLQSFKLSPSDRDSSHTHSA
ncbi:MAG: AraC family transcriptional regulator [Myxococcales bacterium]